MREGLSSKLLRKFEELTDVVDRWMISGAESGNLTVWIFCGLVLVCGIIVLYALFSLLGG